MAIYNVLLVIQIIVSVGIIILVLMQQGKGADAGAAFGSGASGTVFGSQGSGNFLSRTTAILATVFFLNCLGLAFLAANQGRLGSDGSLMTGSPAASQVEPEQESAGDVPPPPGVEAASQQASDSDVPPPPGAEATSAAVEEEKTVQDGKQ